MRWEVHGERPVYESDWLRLVLADVEVPGGRRFEHHVLRLPRHAAGLVVHDRDRGVLLLWRHRFITDTWGWEVPAGGLDPGESAEDGARREALEETGWEPGPTEHLCTFHPSNGLADQTFHVFVAHGARHVGDPVDVSESERVDWVPVPEVRDHLRDGAVTDGLSFAALSYALAFGHLTDPTAPH